MRQNELFGKLMLRSMVQPKHENSKGNVRRKTVKTRQKEDVSQQGIGKKLNEEVEGTYLTLKLRKEEENKFPCFLTEFMV